MSATEGVTVAVVTWNSESVIGGFLEGLPAALEGVGTWEVVVADNASTDRTVEIVEGSQVGVRVVRGDRNAGYAAGINAAVAARALDGPIVVANPDTRPTGGSIAALHRALDQPGVGIAVPRLLADDGQLLHSLRREPTVLRAAGEALLGGGRAGRLPPFGEVVTTATDYEVAHRTDWATGAFMVISAECWDRLGSWDESFFLYSEETEYCLRAGDHGFVVWYDPSAVVEHIGGESRTSPPLYALVAVNKVSLFSRRNGRVATAAFRSASILKEMLRAPKGEPHRTALRALLGRVDPREELER